MNRIKKCQGLLLVWISLHEKVKYETIKKYCEYLTIQYNLCKEDFYPKDIFMPLYLAGNIDFCGDNYFKATEPVVIKGGQYYIYTNVFDQPEQFHTDYPYIFRCKSVPACEFKKEYFFNAVSILRHYPNVQDIVATFQPLSMNDLSGLRFDNYNIKYGIARKTDWDLNYYFIYRENRRVVSVPSLKTVPDALNVAYNYSRSIDGRGNGRYNQKTNELRLTSFRITIMLFRVLFIESLLKGHNPYLDKGEYVFPGISMSVIKEVNRILNHSVRYE